MKNLQNNWQIQHNTAQSNNKCALLVEQWKEVYHDHRSAVSRFTTLASAFPFVLAGAVTLATVDLGESTSAFYSLRYVAPFTPALAICWWAGLLSHHGIGCVMRYKILRILEREISILSSPQVVWPISYVLGKDPPKNDRSRVPTALLVIILCTIACCAYFGSVVYAAMRLDYYDVSLLTILPVSMAFGIVGIVLAILSGVRLVFYLSADYDKSVVQFCNEEHGYEVQKNIPSSAKVED